jgi:diguanylate cyclase (GGDEF)-like protein
VSLAHAQIRDDENRALRALLGALLFGGTALIALHSWFGLAASFGDFFDGPLYDAVVISAGLACLLRAGRGGRERAAWLAIAATILTQGLTELCWTVFYEGDPTPPYPSLCDIGWLAFYPLAATSVLLMVRARARALDWRLWTDGLIAALGTAALGAAFVFEFIANRTTGTTLQEAVTLAYPLGDVFMLALVVGVIALSNWRPGRTWTLLLLGIVALVFADIVSSLESSGLEISGEGWVIPIYMLGAVCIGIEAWQPRPEPIRRASRVDDWRELMVPGLFAVITICLFVIQYVRTVSALTAVLSAATMLAIVARLTVSVLDNKRLLEAVRTDQLTGLANQGALRIDLEGRCRRADEEPATLLLLDLNGFKSFNDSFGHPAGDDLLTRLGGQLREAVGGDGCAYRIGGDEFAVVIDCIGGGAERVSRRAAVALSLRGEGFDVGAAWGAVEIPAEAASPAAALELADVRMYAQKQSRRASERRRHPEPVQ